MNENYLIRGFFVVGISVGTAIGACTGATLGVRRVIHEKRFLENIDTHISETFDLFSKGIQQLEQEKKINTDTFNSATNLCSEIQRILNKKNKTDQLQDFRKRVATTYFMTGKLAQQHDLLKQAKTFLNGAQRLDPLNKTFHEACFEIDSLIHQTHTESKSLNRR